MPDSKTPQEIYESIEEVLGTNFDKIIKRMVGTSEVGTEELHEMRGALQIIKRLTSELRTVLGYEAIL